MKRQPFSRRGELAIRANQEAARPDAMPRREVGDDIVYLAKARLEHARADLRTSAAQSAGVLEPAIDAATSAQAANSIEKMRCHQMAGAHFFAVRLLRSG